MLEVLGEPLFERVEGWVREELGHARHGELGASGAGVAEIDSVVAQVGLQRLPQISDEAVK